MKLCEEFKLYENMWDTPIEEAVSPTYSATYSRLATKFKTAIRVADLEWIQEIINLGVDYGYFDDSTAKFFRKAAMNNIAAGVVNDSAEALAHTGDPKLDRIFEQFIEEGAGNFDLHLDLSYLLFICYFDGSYSFFKPYEETFKGRGSKRKDNIECIIGIDYASGASIGWIRGEDSIEDLDNILNI